MKSWPLPAALLIVVSFLTFANSLGNDFVLDDQALIVENSLIKRLAGLPRLFTTHYWAGFLGETSSGGLYRPLTTLTFALNHAVGGLRPSGYHLVNVAIHAAVAIGLWGLGRRLGLSGAGALVGAAVFAVHPLHVEAVTAVVGRAESLMALGVVGAWIGYLRWTAGGPAGRPWLAVSLVAFAGALLSKEQAMMFPVLLLLTEAVGPGRPAGPPGAAAWAMVGRRLAPYLLVLGLVLALRVAAVGIPTGGDPSLVDNPLSSAPAPVRVLTALKVAGYYLWLMVWPARLSADYSFNAIPLATSVLDPAVLAGSLAWAALIALGVRGAAAPVVPLAVGLTVVAFLPASNLVVAIGTIMGERLFYLPSAGLCLLAGAGWDRLARLAAARRWPAPAALTAVPAALLVTGLAARTVAANQDWATVDTLATATVRVVPTSMRAQARYGSVLRRAGRLDEAAAALEEALRIKPEGPFPTRDEALTYERIHAALADVHERRGRRAEAEQAQQRAVAVLERVLGPDHILVARRLDGYAALLRRADRPDEAARLEARARAIRAARGR